MYLVKMYIKEILVYMIYAMIVGGVMFDSA